jgi:hypothetical protein
VELIVFRKNYPNGKDILPLAFFINAILSKQYNLSDLGTVSRASRLRFNAIANSTQ